jgi:uncharacterized protein YacL
VKSGAAPDTVEQLVRGAACVAGGLLGLLLGRWLVEQRVLLGSINLVYLTLVGLLLGYLLSPPLVRWVQKSLAWFRSLPPDAVLAAGVGTTAALLLTVLLSTVLERVPGFSWQLSLLLTLVLVGASSWFFVVNRQLFLRAGTPPAAAPSAGVPLTVLDTSALIDGRVLGVVETNFLAGRVLLPQIVVYELQRVADASDANRRRRGRRGLEILGQLEARLKGELELVHDSFEGDPVDTQLVKLCAARGARLLTTDYNLAQVAAIGGIRVLNLNELAGALRPRFATGETLSVQITKPGREPGQGLAYLDDGTMVVVEGAADLIGQRVTAAVTSHLQTNVGRMVFAQLES